MSFTKISEDESAYADYVRRTSYAGQYYGFHNNTICKPCYPPEPTMRVQKMPTNYLDKRTLTEVESDLIIRPPPTQTHGQYNPFNNTINKSQLMRFYNCPHPQEATRHSNSIGEYREMGVNRWEWLPHNPQDQFEIPFEYVVDTRLKSKDLFRRRTHTPMDQSKTYPSTEQGNRNKLAAFISEGFTSGPGGISSRPSNGSLPAATGLDIARFTSVAAPPMGDPLSH
jgi:hypothetical protein